MVITITPKEIIERMLWVDFEYFLLRDLTQDEKNELIVKNEPFEIKEDDAYVIGLLKVIYTDNVCHKFNQHILAMLVTKGFAAAPIKRNGEVDEKMPNKNYIGKDVILSVIHNFSLQFPKAYEPDLVWKTELEKYRAYSQEIVDGIHQLNYVEMQGSIPCVETKDVKKLLNPHR
jgi:hypothetical protein